MAISSKIDSTLTFRKLSNFFNTWGVYKEPYSLARDCPKVVVATGEVAGGEVRGEVLANARGPRGAF